MTDGTTPTDDTLASRLLTADKRPSVLADCERLVEDEVNDKGGLMGLPIKAAYKVVCAVKPGIIRESLDHLLDDFVHRLEPFYADHKKAGGSGPAFADALRGKSSQVADALLGITDDRARRAKNTTLKGAYDKLRPQAKKHVEEAVPRVGRTLSRYL